jgi:type III pantothenate kinase
MIVVFDIGNTEIVMGVFDDHELLDHWRIATHPERTVDEFGLLVRALLRESGFDADEIRAGVIGSVVPQMTAVAAEMCERHLGARTIIIDARTPLPIRLDVDEPLSVGADRILNTLAAAQLYRRDTIVVDLGTATTFDCITGDGVFVGGIIAPGVRTGAETLVRRTAKLPRVDLEPPGSVIGRRTETSLRAGIFYGAIDSIDGIVRRIRNEWRKPDALVVATGGLAPMLAPHCRTVDRVEPYITLYGLDLALKAIDEREAAAARPRGAARSRGRA